MKAFLETEEIFFVRVLVLLQFLPQYIGYLPDKDGCVRMMGCYNKQEYDLRNYFSSQEAICLPSDCFSIVCICNLKRLIY